MYFTLKHNMSHIHVHYTLSIKHNTIIAAIILRYLLDITLCYTLPVHDDRDR